MAGKDRAVSLAQTEVTLWNYDRHYWGFRGDKGYRFARNTYHRAVRRYSKKLCEVPEVEIVAQRLWGQTVYVHNVSDVNNW